MTVFIGFLSLSNTEHKQIVWYYQVVVGCVSLFLFLYNWLAIFSIFLSSSIASGVLGSADDS